MLKLYHFERSPFSWKVRFVLAEKGIPHETIVPNDKANDPAYAKLNPMRLTPVLQISEGRNIYESSIINEYLEETHPSPALLPKDPYERARIRMIEDTADQYFYPATRAYLNAAFDINPPVLTPKKASAIDQKQVDEARSKIHEHLARYESELGSRTWFGGETVSLADAGLVGALTGTMKLLGLLPDTTQYPKLSAWMSRITERPSWKASQPKEFWSIQS